MNTDRGSAADTLVVACPVDSALNRVPRARLGGDPKCGTCHSPLFQGRTVALTAANFDRHTLRSELPIVIDFWAAWCGPCRMMSPSFEAAAAQLEPRVRMAKLDTEAEPALAARFAIRGIPSMILIRRGVEIARTSGAMSTAAIVQWVEQALARA
ncbi:thioredoxin TrxC [Sphingomonas oligophenolica]|uniref:Thioredoxin n=1 Tax=Sphingomonas oligophenolica TaxID=301154 RepID=A0ABU9Y0X5_9SPHN